MDDFKAISLQNIRVTQIIRELFKPPCILPHIIKNSLFILNYAADYGKMTAKAEAADSH